MNAIRQLLLACFILVGGAALFYLAAGGQPPPGAETPRLEGRTGPVPGAVLESQRAVRVLEQRADGTVVPRTITINPGGSYDVQVPFVGPADPELAKLYAEEQAAADEAAKLAAQIRRPGVPGADTEENREQLREKLSTIFDLQQQRRAHEVAKIEARLASLKEIMKKREDAKDSIVDRRLQLVTGGVDELGWEETRQVLPPPTFAPGYNVPTVAPTIPLEFPPSTSPPTVQPRAKTSPALPPPSPPSVDE